MRYPWTFAGAAVAIVVGTWVVVAMNYPANVVGRFWDGFVGSVTIIFFGCLVATVCGFLGALGKMSSFVPLRWLAVTYIEIFRGTSAYVQLFWIFFVVPELTGISLSPLMAAIFGIGINVGAYAAEVMRGAIQSIPKGQWEASIAVNLGRFDTLREVILPQAVVAMMPPMGNLFIELMKVSALAIVVTQTDITMIAQQLFQAPGGSIEVFVAAFFLYFGIALTITTAMRFLETRLAGHWTARRA